MAKEPQSQYNEVCKAEFEEIKDMIKSMHDKLFVGNGQPPISVQLDRLNMFKKVSVWFYGALSIASIGLVARLIHDLISK